MSCEIILREIYYLLPSEFYEIGQRLGLESRDEESKQEQAIPTDVNLLPQSTSQSEESLAEKRKEAQRRKKEQLLSKFQDKR